MAVKASASVTLSKTVDVSGVTRYYQLVASTASAPAKPTTNPPASAWTSKEPGYDGTTTNTLYFTDMTVLSDGTFSFSDVSKSSSYEAAKQAYNKATTAQTTANASLSKVVVEYAVGTSATTAPTSGWSSATPTWESGKYVWQRTGTKLNSASSYTYTYACIQGAKGDDGKGVASIVEQYYQSTSATSQTGGSWSGTYPGWVDGKYIWTRSVITYTDATTTTTTPVCVTGSKGGSGDQGTSITNVDVWYYQSTSATSLSGGSWSTTAPTWANGKYIWTKTITTYSTGKTSESEAACITGQQGSTGAGFQWNLLAGTSGSQSIIGADKSNQCWHTRYFASGKTLYQGALELSTTYTVSVELEVSDTGSSSSFGTAKIQHNNTPWGGLAKHITLVAGTQTLSGTFTTPSSYSSTATTNGVMIRMDDVPTTVTVKASKMMLTKGATVTPWCTTQAETIGAKGESVTKVAVTYGLSTSNASDGYSSVTSWTTDIPDWETGKYIWQKSVTTIGTTSQSPVYALYGALNSLASTVNGHTTQIKQDGENITAIISTQNTQGGSIADLQDGVSGNTDALANMQTWLQVNNDGLTMGKSDSPYISKMDNEMLGFYAHSSTGDTELASFGANGMDIPTASIDQLTVEPYIVTVRNGHLLIQYGGE